jgi:hypothetical protein
MPPEEAFSRPGRVVESNIKEMRASPTQRERLREVRMEQVAGNLQRVLDLPVAPTGVLTLRRAIMLAVSHLREPITDQDAIRQDDADDETRRNRD